MDGFRINIKKNQITCHVYRSIPSGICPNLVWTLVVHTVAGEHTLHHPDKHLSCMQLRLQKSEDTVIY